MAKFKQACFCSSGLRKRVTLLVLCCANVVTAQQTKDFAKKFGLSYSALNETLNAKRPISTEFALFLEVVLGINTDLLVRMQADYNIQVARKNNSLRENLNNIKKIAAAF